MKLVIVDDEYFVRMGITAVASKIPRIEVVGEAENGETALAVIRQQQPDLVFLDITMPGKDGLEVLKELREEGFQKQIVLLTSHDDFQLTRKALRLGANDYVLKNELIGEKMLDYLKAKQEEGFPETEHQRIEPATTGDHSLYKERFLQNMLRFGGIEKAEFLKAQQDYQLGLSTTKFYIILVELANWRELMTNYSEASQQMIYQKVSGITAAAFPAPFEYENFYNRQNQYTLLVANPSETSGLIFEQQLQTGVDRFVQEMMKQLQIPVKLAVYRNAVPLAEINEAYRHARQLLEQQFFKPTQQIFWKGILNEYPASDLTQLSEALKLMANSPGQRLSETLRNFLQDQKDRLINERDFFALVIPAIRQLAERAPVSVQVAPEDFENIESLLTVIEGIEAEIMAYDETKQYSHIVRQGIAIIQGRFKERLTLDEVANELEVSTSYFSRLFSNETGVPFSQYLTQKRVEHARDLLLTTNLKLYEISELSGFSSPIYFNNSFKKSFGMTPKRYRDVGAIEEG